MHPALGSVVDINISVIEVMEGENKMNHPFECHEVGPEETEALLNYFNREIFTQFIRVSSNGYFMFKELDTIIGDIYNMPLRPSDTFVVTFPRSGTTWTQELVWLLQNNLDFETAKDTPLGSRFPFLELAAFPKLKIPEEVLQKVNIDIFKEDHLFMNLEKIKAFPTPRFIKSHSPLSLLPPSLLETVKVVYVARDPRDVAVSNFYHFKSIRMIPEDKGFKEFWNFFVQNKVLWTPYFDHLIEAWRQRNHPNMRFIFYEELSKDLPGVARRLAKFFGKEYCEEQFEALSNYLKFDNFKNNKSVNLADLKDIGIIAGSFIRKGKPSGWHEHFDEEMTRQAERWIADNLRGTDLQYPHVD